MIVTLLGTCIRPLITGKSHLPTWLNSFPVLHNPLPSFLYSMFSPLAQNSVFIASRMLMKPLWMTDILWEMSRWNTAGKLSVLTLANDKPWLKSSMLKAHASLVLNSETMENAVLYKRFTQCRRLGCISLTLFNFVLIECIIGV